MANRKLQRSVLLQTLYEWDMRGLDAQAVLTYLNYTASSFNKTTSEDVEELNNTVLELVKKQVVIDEIIEKAAPGWPLAKISMTDRNVLRIGLFELLFADREQIPAKVAINEAIELAKRFGGPKSGKFVNGVIGAVYKEIGEPGKEEETKTKMPEVAYEDMPIEQKGSAVVYSVDDQGVIRLGMVHDVFGYWTLAKGSIKEDESVEEGTIRKVKEETNWNVEIVEKIGDNEYIAYPPKKGPTRKQVQYFLAKSPYVMPMLESESGGLDDVRWFELHEISDLTIYEDVSQMLINSIEVITKGEGVNNNLGATHPDLAVPDLESLGELELRRLAENRGVENIDTFNKEQLIKLLAEG